MCTSLVELISICYSQHSQRTPKRILRRNNQCFQLSIICKRIIWVSKKMTSRKFYGCHFHGLTVHALQTYRLFCLLSLIPEQEERSFGDLRPISLRTSSRQCGKVKTEIVAPSNRNLLSATRQSSCHQQKIQLSRFIFLSQCHTYFRLILNRLQITFYLGKITGGLLKEIKLSFMMDQNV